MAIGPNRPGACVELVSPDKETYYIPISEDFIASASQNISRPIEELFNLIKSTVLNASGNYGGGLAQGFAKAGMDLQDLIGTRLGGKSYYMAAWKGAKASSVELKLDFKLGWRGLWDAKKECVDTAYTIMGQTVPGEGKTNTSGETIVLFSPMPSSLDVYVTYGADLINGAISSVTSGATEIAQNLGAKTSKITNDDIQGSVAKGGTEKTGLTLGRVWTVTFGYYNANNLFNPILTLGDNVVETSRIISSPQMQKIGNKYYPIKTTVSLNMIAKDVYTKQQFLKHLGGN